MASEPIMLFARTADLAGVARRLRELAPGVRIDGTDADWRRAVVTLGGWLNKRTLVINHDPDYHAEPNWSAQMNGLRGYLSRFPESGRKAAAVMLPTTFRFGIAVELAPAPRGELNAGGDARLELLYAVAELLDGVFFTPSSLRDARGRVLFSAGGAADEDPGAEWPAVVGHVPVPDAAGGAEEEDGDEDDAEPDPPTAERVARRALALTAVSVRGLLERDADEPGAARMHEDMLAWMGEVGFADELEADERETVHRALGRLDPQAQVDAVWRLEGLAVLAWSLGRFALPAHDALVRPEDLWRSMGLMDTGAARALLAEAALRPREEIEALRRRLFAIHWRLRDFALRPNLLDFAEFARTAWFGPLDIAGLPLADGDLALGGGRLDRAPEDALGTAYSAASERHQAANWLAEGPARYSDASVAT